MAVDGWKVMGNSKLWTFSYIVGTDAFRSQVRFDIMGNDDDDDDEDDNDDD